MSRPVHSVTFSVFSISVSLLILVDAASWQTLSAQPLSLDFFNVRTRYNFTERSDGFNRTDAWQYSASVGGRLDLLFEGRVALHFRASSGDSFRRGWNFIAGVGRDANVDFSFRHLYLSAEPIRGVHVEWGGLGFRRGQATEITTYDNDGYLVGQRLRIQRPKDLFFDEISVTQAFLGDPQDPSVFERLDRLDQSNYQQFLVAKRASSRVLFSASYTRESGRRTIRQAVDVSLPELKVVESLRFENYQRINDDARYGFALQAAKSFNERIRVQGGISDVDPAFGDLNGGRYGIGRRLFIVTDANLGRGFGFQFFAQRAFDNDFPLSNETRIDVILSYDLLHNLERLSFVRK